jgi:hypothetical protein
VRRLTASSAPAPAPGPSLARAHVRATAPTQNRHGRAAVAASAATAAAAVEPAAAGGGARGKRLASPRGQPHRRRSKGGAGGAQRGAAVEVSLQLRDDELAEAKHEVALLRRQTAEQQARIDEAMAQVRVDRHAARVSRADGLRLADVSMIWGAVAARPSSRSRLVMCWLSALRAERERERER